MPSDKDLKDQRDRFLAFAFAGADLMLEVDAKGTIVYAVGAAKGIGGASDGKLTGKSVSDIFAAKDRGLIGSLRAGAKAGVRFGPVLVNLNEEQTSFKVAMLSGVAMPDKPGHVYLTISKGALSQVAGAKEARNESQGALLDKDSFAEAALEMIAASDTLGQKLGMTFVDLPDAKNFKGKIGDEKWKGFRENISTLLRTYAADGRAAAALDDGRFGVVHGENISAEMIQKNIEAMSRDADPEKTGVKANANSIEMTEGKLNERELARAVMYTINQFEKQGGAFNILNLEGGFENYLSQNAQKIADFKQVIHQGRFELKYQPIVKLEDASVAYYEALVRFEGGKSPYEAIVFCEEVGLSPELDLAICGKIINYLVFSAPKSVKISVNLSGISIQNEKFIENLRSKLEPHLKSDIPKRMVFEITESSQITDLDKVNTFVQALQKDGFKVALDDFGAGSASFQYLHKIHVDTIKIDGQYIMNILNSQRDQAMISNLVRMCADLKVGVVAERVETKEHVDILKKMGVELGQGYYYAKPLDEPNYKPKTA